MLERFRQNKHFVLIVGDSATILGQAWQPAIVASAGDRLAENKIMSVIDAQPLLPIFIYSDSAGQDFQSETAPPLNPFDRARLLRRRAQILFPSARHTAYKAIDRHQAIVAALPDQSPVLRWLDRLESRHVQVGLLPLECADLVRRIVPESIQSWVLLMLPTESGGLRQIVTRSGAVVFTRLTPAKNLSALHREVTANLGYLMRLGLRDSRDLRVVVVQSQNDSSVDGDNIPPVHSFLTLSPPDMARLLGVILHNKAPPDINTVLVGWLLNKNRVWLDIAPPYQKSLRRTHKIQYIGMRIAAFLLVTALAINGWMGIGILRDIINIQQARQGIVHIQQQAANEEHAAFPQTGMFGKFHAALERQRLFAQPMATPWPLLNKLLQGVGDSARLVRLDWRASVGKEPETAVIDVRLVNNVSPTTDKGQRMMDNARQLSRMIAESATDYDLEVIHYPVPTLPQDVITKSETDISGLMPGSISQFSLKRSGHD